MRLHIFSFILTFCLATLIVSSSSAIRRDEINATVTLFRYPQLNDSIPEYTNEFNSWLAYWGSKNVSIITISEYAPNIGIDIIFKLLSFKFGNLPGFNNSFDIPDFNNTQILEAENRSRDDPVILFSHGGGFSLPLQPNHVYQWAKLYNSIGNVRLSIVILDYTISLIAPFPEQLIEKIKSYNYLTESSNNIWLAGDSAGGSLSLELIRQYYQSYDGVPAVTSWSPNGLIAISPWVNLNPSYNSDYVTYNGIDTLTYISLDQFGKQYEPDLNVLTSKSLNPYEDDIDWSKYLPPSKNIFISYGKKEVLQGDIINWIQLANLGNGSDATIYGEVNGTHDLLLGSPTSATYPVLVEFLQKNL